MSYEIAASDTPGEDRELRRNGRLLLAATAGVVCSSVVLPFYTMGVLLKPVTAEFGWSRAEFQAAILFSGSLGALAGPFIGSLIDRHGARRVALPGLLGLSLGFLLAACMDGSLAMFYTAYACMALLGAGTTPIAWTRAIATAFVRHRGLALGIALSGSGLCALGAPLYVGWLVETWGWRAAYAGLALLPLLLAGPLVYAWFRDASPVLPGAAAAAPPVEGLRLGEAVRGYRFWVLLLSILLVYFAVSGIAPNLIPALTDNGLGAAQAATLQGVYGISIVLARVLIGLLVDRFWAPGVACASLLLPVAGCLLLTGPAEMPLLVFAVASIGFAAGAELDLMSFLAARYFGLRHYAAIYAVLYGGLAICSGLAPPLFAAVYDRSGSYAPAFLVAALLFTAGALVVLALGRYPARINAA